MKRTSGVLMHVSSLFGDHSEGAFGAEAFAWIDFLADCGFGLWQVLPFCLPDDCHSPYKSFSAFSGNPNFIDLPALYREGLITAEELASAKQVTPYSCEFERLEKERMPLLARAARRFPDAEAIDAFMVTHPQVEKFCEFMALRKANGNTPWNEWTQDTPDADALLTWRFTQYTFDRQWRAVKEYANRRGIRIIGDMPIYVAYDSADVWANPSEFLLDKENKPTCVAGVPPDYFCPDGQLWGNPLYDWKAMKKNGYAWWCARMRAACDWFDGVRIDHFRGIESYYTVDATAKNARNGVWKKGPGMHFVRAMQEEHVQL